MSTLTRTLWKIDETHSEIQFKVKHLVISTVTGKFKDFEGQLEADGDSFENAEVRFEADVNSIDTNNEDRDNHLKSDDFFNASEYPMLRFESDTFTPNGDNTYEMTGNLTIRDITREVTLQVVHGGTVDDPYGQTKAGFEISGTIDRKKFGLKWSAVTEAGSVVVGDEVKLNLNVQLVQN